MFRRIFIILLASVALGACAAEPYQLVDNFNAPWPGSASISCDVDSKDPKVGMSAARLTYHLDGNQRRASINLPDGFRVLAGPGVMKLWIRGDGSTNEIEFMVRHAKMKTENDGRKSFYEHGQQNFPRIKLNFTDWREFTLDAKAIPDGKVIWLDRVDIHGSRPDKNNPEPKMEGSIGFDDLRLYPSATKPVSTFQFNLLGPTVRELSKEISFALDIRSFSPKNARIKARLNLQDRNGNKVAEKDFPLDLDANESKEFKLDLQPDNLEAYLPPFNLTGDVLSTDLPEVATTIDQALVMGNAELLFEDFSNVYGHWFTAGYAGNIAQNQRAWLEWTHGEGQRAGTVFQNTAAISRVELKAAGNPTPPAAKSAMRVEYNGEALVYSSIDRYLPGNPYRIGYWIKGDGSGAKVNALILDYTNGADFWAGGWKRIYHGEETLCKLDFTGWKYIERELPGHGIGTNLPRGSTDALDFPLELTAFRIIPEATTKTGSVEFGPILVTTQQTLASTLAAHIGYDDPDFQFSPERNAWVTIQNGWLTGQRKIKSAWSLQNRTGEQIAAGSTEVELPGRALKVLPIELSKFAAACEKQPGPFRLQVVVSDSSDQSISVTRQVILAKPDSLAVITDFESDRAYYGLKSGSRWMASTSTEQAQSGKRALKIEWSKEKNAQISASIDPEIPGMPVEISMQVYGDSSGVLLYPVLGGTTGVNHGSNQSNFFLLRRLEGEPGSLQNGVLVNWNGWKELKFRLPQIPINWDQQNKILPFIPTYPVGLHLFVDAQAVTAPAGNLYIDELKARSHLESASRVSLSLERPNESNVNSAGRCTLNIQSFETSSSRKLALSGTISDWRNVKVAGVDQNLELKPGEKQTVALSEKLRPGAYALKAEVLDNGKSVASLQDDLIVANLESVLGAEWPEQLKDEWKLRVPIKDAFAPVDEDWDWVEHYPGNLQMDTIRERSRLALKQGGDPYVLLGYGAYWTAGVGYEQMKAGAFNRRQRDIGHAVDIFMTPTRIEDWDNYVSEVMRGAGDDVHGWILWDNPDNATSSLKVEPSKFAQMIHRADTWRTDYCPKIPLVIGGMSRNTAIPYLEQLRTQELPDKTSALKHINGVQVRLDVGRLSPEDAEVLSYVRELLEALKSSKDDKKTVLLSDLDWAIEKEASGLSAFDQAAFLSRSDFLLNTAGIRPLLSIRNDDVVRLGLGLVHRRRVAVPPMTEKVATHDLKPAWWAMVQTRKLLEEMKFITRIEIQDIIPDRTQCLLYERKDSKTVAVIWRNNELGEISFEHTGLKVSSTEDVLSTPMQAKDGWYSSGKMPAIYVFDQPATIVAQGMGKLWVRDNAESFWPQRPLLSFAANVATIGYTQNGTTFTDFQANLYGERREVAGVRFSKDGKEKLSLAVPKGASLVLRKTFVLDETGQSAIVKVNGKAAGIWNLKRGDPKFSGGLRTSCFVIPPELLAGSEQAEIELEYSTPGNSVAWSVLEYRSGNLPLNSFGVLHAEQNFGHIHVARNITGGKLKIGTTDFSSGTGVFAQSLQEIALNKQFSRFTAKAGIDAITEGRGSVIFEVHADGKKIWSSKVLSGLDQPVSIDVDVKGVERLRLVVTDAGDGNKFDAADWGDPELVR